MTTEPDITRFATPRGLALASYRFAAPHAPAARLVLAHGWGDHLGRYAEVAGALAERGIACSGVELEGHGRSPGRRAVIRDFGTLVEDFAAFLAHERARDRTPLFVHGYSMGGCIAATLLATTPALADGVVFHGAALARSPHISRRKVVAARLLGSVAPRLPVGRLTHGALMTRDPERAAAYDRDPLVHHGAIDAGTGKALLRANLAVDGMLERIVTPFLAVQGGRDELVDPDGARALLARAGAEDKQLRVFDDARHDLFLEEERDEVIEAIRAFVLRVAARAR